MKKKYNLTGIISLTINTLLFYLLPLFSGPTDVMGLIVLLLISTLILSFIVGMFCTFKAKYLYPLIIAIVFLPTIFIYYNISATLYVLFHFIVSLIGLIIGLILRYLVNIILKKA